MSEAIRMEGELVRLREERAEDVAILRDLRNDLETQAWTKTLPPDYTQEMYMKRHTDREFSYDRSDARFAVVWKETDTCIGTIGYSGLKDRWSASIGIVISKDYWGTGAAYEAQEILLRFLFEELGLRVVRLWTNSGNPGAVGLAEKAGFVQSAWQRETVFRRGELYDNLTMDLLREEYYALHPELTDGLPPLTDEID